MENLIFSLNATVPVFLMMVIGMVLRRIGWVDEDFASKANKFVFRLPLPFLLFSDLATVDFTEVWDLKFVLFCFLATLASIAISAGVSQLFSDRSIRGEIHTGLVSKQRCTSWYCADPEYLWQRRDGPADDSCERTALQCDGGDRLSLYRPGDPESSSAMMKRTLKGIATNPIILGIVFGMAWSVLRLPMPRILDKTVSSIGAMATPLGLIAMGATRCCHTSMEVVL